MTARMTGAEYNQKVRDAWSEKHFTAQVVELAERCGWLVYHTFDSRRSQPGYPDLTMVRDGRVIFAELKTVKGRLSAAQKLWLAALSGSESDEWKLSTMQGTSTRTVACWTPVDWPNLLGVLS